MKKVYRILLKGLIGTTTLQVSGGVDNKEGAKILSTASRHKPDAKGAGKAAAILATVNGEEMLDSIVVASKEEQVKALGGAASVTTTPLKFCNRQWWR